MKSRDTKNSKTRELIQIPKDDIHKNLGSTKRKADTHKNLGSAKRPNASR